ncbi:hypothetical protein Tco_1281002 [Tanacetum coccineum]
MARDHTDQLLTDLVEAQKNKKKRHDSPKTSPGSPPHQPPPPPPPVGPSGTLGTSGAFGSSKVTPPPPPPSTNQSDQSQSTAAPSSSKTDASAESMAWTTTDTRLKPCVSSIPEELHMDDDTTPDEQWKPLTEDRPATPEPAWSIPLSDLPIPLNNWRSSLASTYAPPLEKSLLAQTSDMAIFMDWFCKKQRITKLKQQDLEGPVISMDQSKITRKQSKNGQARTRESEEYKAEARKVKPQSNHGQQKSTRPNNPIPGFISPRH